MDELELLLLDRELAKAVPSWRRWQRALRQGHEVEADPFAFSPVIHGETWSALNARPDSDPLKAPVRRWLYRLLDERVNAAQIADAARARWVDAHPLDQPVRGSFTVSTMLRRALGERATRGAWLAALLTRAGDTGERTALLWERRLELARRLGLGTPDELELVCPEVGELAERWLTDTADLAEEWRRDDFGEVLELALGSELAADWPKLTARTIADLLREARWLASLDLDVGPLPPGLGASSWLRAFARLGAAIADAGAARDQPFAVAHDAFGARRYATGALLGSVPSSPPFLRRALGLGRERARDQARVLARVVLLATRAAALRVVLRGPALGGGRTFGEAFVERVAQAFGPVLPTAAAGVLFRLRPDDSQRFAGWLGAAARAARATEEHDDDWYRSPRAVEQLRAELASPDLPTCSSAALRLGADTLARTLADALR